MPGDFRAWLAQHSDEDSPIGDLARDAARDRCPDLKYWTTADELWEHMRGQHQTSDRAEDAFAQAVAAFNGSFAEIIRKRRDSK